MIKIRMVYDAYIILFFTSLCTFCFSIVKKSKTNCRVNTHNVDQEAEIQGDCQNARSVVLSSDGDSSVLVDPGEEGGHPGEGLGSATHATQRAEGHDSDQLLDSAVGHGQRATAVTLSEKIYVNKRGKFNSRTEIGTLQVDFVLAPDAQMVELMTFLVPYFNWHSALVIIGRLTQFSMLLAEPSLKKFKYRDIKGYF